jgi:hypothetical protein
MIVANNFCGAVTFGPFGSDITTDYLALRVQPEDGMVLDSVQEHLMFSFTIPECRLQAITVLRVRCRTFSLVAFILYHSRPPNGVFATPPPEVTLQGLESVLRLSFRHV